MQRLTNKGAGGFFLYDDPIDKISIGKGTHIIFALMVLMPVFPMAVKAKAFGSMAVCLFTGIAILLYIGNMDMLEFLRPLAMPFLLCAAICYSIAVFSFADSLIGFILIITVPIYLFFVLYIAFISLGLFESDGLVSVLCVPVGAFIWYATYKTKGSENIYFKYLNLLVYAAFILAMIAVFCAFVKFLKEEKKTGRMAGDLILNFCISLFGYISLALAVSFGKGRLTLVLSFTFLLVYIIKAAFVAVTVRIFKLPIRGTSEAMLLPFILAGLCYFSDNANFKLKAVNVITGVFKHFPFHDVLADSAVKLLDILGTLYASIVYGMSTLFSKTAVFRRPSAEISFFVSWVILMFFVIGTPRLLMIKEKSK